LFRRSSVNDFGDDNVSDDRRVIVSIPQEHRDTFNAARVKIPER